MLVVAEHWTMAGPGRTQQLATRRSVFHLESKFANADDLGIGCFHSPLPADAYISCLAQPPAPTGGSFFHSLSGTSPVRQTSGTRRAVFIGDSTVRQLYYSAAKVLDGGKGRIPLGFESGEKHSDKKVLLKPSVGEGQFSSETLSFEFWW